MTHHLYTFSDERSYFFDSLYDHNRLCHGSKTFFREPNKDEAKLESMFTIIQVLRASAVGNAWCRGPLCAAPAGVDSKVAIVLECSAVPARGAAAAVYVGSAAAWRAHSTFLTHQSDTSCHTVRLFILLVRIYNRFNTARTWPLRSRQLVSTWEPPTGKICTVFNLIAKSL